MTVLDSNVLVLNRFYQPVNVTTVRRAFALLYQCTAKAIDQQYRTFDFDSWSALAAELGKDKINVNSIAPGNVATPLNAHVRGPGNEEYVELMKTFTPTGIDFMDPDDMTGTAVFLATEDSRMIHGETIIVDAGWSVW